MRLIGHLKDETQAKTLADYLAGLDIKNQTDPEDDGSWAIWIYSEDHVDQGREIFNEFVAEPTNPKFKKFTGKAAELEEKEAKDQERWEKRVKTRQDLNSGINLGWLTIFMILVCVLVFLAKYLGYNRFVLLFYISESYNSGLAEVRSGQIWRLITPIFLHFGFIHIFFNMLWLKDLGSAIERRQGTFQFAMMVLLMAVVPNFCQYFVSGPNFGGMSGVVYGLLGYVWIRSKFDPFSGYHIDKNTVYAMLVWLVVCLVIPWLHVANTVHFVGLAIGAALGYVPVLMRKWR